MKKALIIILGIYLASVLVRTAKAVTVNPASSVTADSANTALTIIYRDANGAFSAGIASLTGLTMSGPINPQARTIAQLQSIVPAVGDTYLCSNCATAYNIVTATGTAAGNFLTQGQTQFK